MSTAQCLDTLAEALADAGYEGGSIRVDAPNGSAVGWVKAGHYTSNGQW